MRDSQKSKLYLSEAVLHNWTKEKLPAVGDVEAYADKVWASKRIRAAFPIATGHNHPRPVVKDGRGTSHARGGAYFINIPRWARNPVVVLHELAHTINSRELCGRPHAGHGWEFCATFLKLVLYMLGREAHDKLKAEMKACRVRFRPPRKSVPLSPERREQMIAVLAAARERRKSDGR